MAEQQSPLTSFGDPTKINPYGASDEAIKKYQDALQGGITSLEQRYAQPNFMNIAAGFLKPQLGGLSASLGSAAQAYGENIEQQRAQQLPIAQLKAQLAQSEIAMDANKNASKKVADRRARNLPITPEFVAEIVSLAPDSAVAKSLSAELQTQQKQQEITSKIQLNALKAIEAARVAGVEINPELYKQAGLKPPSMISSDSNPPNDGRLPREILPTDMNTSGASVPSNMTTPSAQLDKNVQRLPNGARVNDEQMKLSQLGIPIISGIRTQEEQDDLKHHQDNKGNWFTKEGLPVANNASSHLSGHAIDVDSSKLTDENRGALKALGYKQTMPTQDPNHWEMTSVPQGGTTPAKKQVIATGEYNFNPLYTPADASKLRSSTDDELNKNANSRYGTLEAVANPKTFRESQNAIESMIKTITSNSKLAKEVTNPLAQKSGIVGGLLSAAEAGMGFNVSGLAGQINIPVSSAIIGSYNKEQRTFYDVLNTQSAKVAQIQQAMNNVNPSSIRSGEIELYKNASVNPRTQFPNVMLYNLQYSKLNNEMLREMYEKANSIRTNRDKEYSVHPHSRTQMLDIMTSPAMSSIAEKYKEKFDNLNEEFLKNIQPKKK